MIKKISLLLLFLAISLYSKSYLISPLPPVKNEIMNIHNLACDKNCQNTFLEKGKIFYFLSHFDSKNKDEKLQSSYMLYQSLLNIEANIDGEVKIAILTPADIIGRYTTVVTNAVIAYFLSNGVNFEIEIFNSENEDEKNINTQLKEIENRGFKYLIAPVTLSGAQILATNRSKLSIFIPTVHKSEIGKTNDNITFGGISYDEQIRMLLALQKNSDITIFYEDLQISKKLSNLAKINFDKKIKTVELDTSKTKFSKIFKNLNMNENSSILLNTRPVNSSLLLSQLTYNDINISTALSTQLNYTPLILTLTQTQDLKKLLIANSITTEDIKTTEYNSILQNEINYNWINYSTSVLTDIIYQRRYDNFINGSQLFKVKIKDKQLIYNTKIFQITDKKFIPYDYQSPLK